MFFFILRGTASEKWIMMLVWLEIWTCLWKTEFGEHNKCYDFVLVPVIFIKSGIDNPSILILRNIISHEEIRSKLNLIPHRLSGHKDPPNFMWNVGSWNFARRSRQAGEMEENASHHASTSKKLLLKTLGASECIQNTNKNEIWENTKSSIFCYLMMNFAGLIRFTSRLGTGWPVETPVL